MEPRGASWQPIRPTLFGDPTRCPLFVADHVRDFEKHETITVNFDGCVHPFEIRCCYQKALVRMRIHWSDSCFRYVPTGCMRTESVIPLFSLSMHRQRKLPSKVKAKSIERSKRYFQDFSKRTLPVSLGNG